MLVEFNVSNYRSLRSKVTLSLVASPDDNYLENTFLDPSGKLRLLKSAVIYGPNASGKSNIIKALGLMRQIILSSHDMQRGQHIDVTPFMLDESDQAAPTQFEVTFITDGVKYTYGFSATQLAIADEWLYEASMAGRRISPRLLFERHRKPDGSYDSKFGEYWKPRNDKIADSTLENQLYLAKFAQNNHELAGTVYDWFLNRYCTMINNSDVRPDIGVTADLCLNDECIHEQVGTIMREADLGIQSIRCIKDTSSRDGYRVKTLHLLQNGGHSVEFDLQHDESDGTQRLFALAGPFIQSIFHGNVLFCDELDSSLHPMLTRAMVKLVHQQASAPFQFVFTTHDCSLLDGDLFRRDQIWFTEKDTQQQTTIHPLWGSKARVEQNFRKAYMAGRYGAVPSVREFTV